MVPYYGDFAEDDTVNIPFNTFSSDDPSASVTITDLADADIKVHKDAHVDQIVTDGATVVINFDGITGNHMINIDTSVDAAYTTGSEYQVRIEGTTVDGATINAWIGAFSIERAGGVLARLETLITTVGTAGDGLTEAGGDGDHLNAINLPNQTMDITGNITGNLSGSVGTCAAATVSAIGANVITAASINADAITAAKIADDAISAEHLNTGVLTADAFAADAIVAATLATGAISADAFAADAIVAATLATGALTADAFAANALVAATFAADCITEAKIADNAIAAEHLNATACTKIIDDFETQSQADPTGFHVNVKEVNGTAQTANDNGADINEILIDTDELQVDDTPTALSTIDTVVDAIKVVTDALTEAAATKLALSAGTIVTGTVSWDNTNATTTVFYSDDITEATADHFNGRIIIFTSGALQYQATDITDYELDTGEGKFTVTALTEAPADNVTFIII